MKPNLTNPGKVIITVATTGGLHGREANPNLPEQPRDIVQNFHDCYNAGASVAHIHVRDRQGVTTSDLSVYGEVVSGIMDRCPTMITQVGNGIGLRYEDPKKEGDPAPQVTSRPAPPPSGSGVFTSAYSRPSSLNTRSTMSRMVTSTSVPMW